MIDSNPRTISEGFATRLDPRELAEYQEAIAPPPPVVRIGLLSDPADEETYTIKFIDVLEKPTLEEAYEIAANVPGVKKDHIIYVSVDGKYLFPEKDGQTTIGSAGSITEPGDAVFL
jgi:hypothetical protein